MTGTAIPSASQLPAESQPAANAENARIAERLRQAAELLEAQGANPFRVGAYRRAADTLEQFGGSLREVFAANGRAGLDALPNIGLGIAAAIAEMLERGRWSQLDRLRGSLDPMKLFRTVPGIGPELAQRIHDALGVETLEGLEVACYEGRLDQVPGLGRRRVAAIRAALAEMLGRSRPLPRGSQRASAEPAVALLLDVDREYLDKAGSGALPRIAPRRFNPRSEAWLPILHTSRDSWHFTALFSNTARAHELGRTRDWVVLYFNADDHAERQRTIVTEQRGALAGRRVVRGREQECREYYRAKQLAA